MSLTEKKENEKVEMKEDWVSSSKSPLKQSKDLNALENQILLLGTQFWEWVKKKTCKAPYEIIINFSMKR